MKNKLSDLNNHLFETLDFLNDRDIDGEKLETEIKRAKAITDVSDKIIQNANLQLNAAKLMATHGAGVSANLPMIEQKPKP
ncbi:hypothetical protein [Litorimonas haliclonae]|uniref:hypothetical protein n=1 Tax=Litorimonas haliclonae TaxID=2081977 RepID=UPI0039EF311C